MSGMRSDYPDESVEDYEEEECFSFGVWYGDPNRNTGKKDKVHQGHT